MSKKRKRKPSGKPTEPLAVRLPTRREIAKLPRWARVAFAARCARRVQPLCKVGWPTFPPECVIAIDRAISLAERQSAVAHGDRNHAASARGLVNHFSAHLPDTAPSFGACAASSAADAAAHARHEDSRRAWYAMDAADAAATAAGYVDTDAAIRRDFELLRHTAKGEGWTDDTPIPPEFFGPLWAEGTPEGCPDAEEDSSQSELVIDIDIAEDSTDEDVSRVVQELVTELDGLHRAYGGRGLKIADLEIFQDAPVQEEVLR